MSWDNTAPLAIPAAAGQSNAAPGALAAGAAPSNVAPAAFAAAGGHNNGAPTAIAAAGGQSGVAPGSIAASTGAAIAFVGDLTNASAIIATTAPYVALLAVGIGVRGAGIPAGATITALGATTVTLSVPATATSAAAALQAFRPPSATAAAAGPSNTAPTAIVAAGGGTGATPGVIDASAAFTDSPAYPPSDDAMPLPLPSMPSIFIPGFINLTGGGNSLSTLTASVADATAGKIVQGTVNGELKTYQVRAYAGAQDLPGIVLPANFHAVNNPVAFFQAGL